MYDSCSNRFDIHITLNHFQKYISNLIFEKKKKKKKMHHRDVIKSRQSAKIAMYFSFFQDFSWLLLTV